MKSFFRRKGLNFVLFLQFFTTVLLTRGFAETNTTCPVNQFQCDNNNCLPISWNCDRDDDCGDNSDERDCPDVTCAEDEFRCNNGKCIPQRWSCDQEPDCSDESDENDTLCRTMTCGPNQFTCDSGSCIEKDWVCDGSSDCKETDGEDEKDCPATCHEGMFQCYSGQCISARWRCDNDADCKDKSDEDNCPPKPSSCPSGQFQCNDSACISEDWKCDGDIDCNDGSDEDESLKCNETEIHCTDTQFRCKKEPQCIHLSWYCDNDDDCEDKTDEDCNATCRPDQFMCTIDHYCLSNSVKCDGEIDCTDGTDEVNCTIACNADQFNCGDKCISRELVCDGSDDCGNFADESNDLGCANNPCQTNNGGCEHKCVNLFRNQHKCVCFPGYGLMKGSTTVCDDINECKDNHIHGVCSQTCINTKGSYKCECMTNYSLINSRYCKAIESQPELLLADRKDLRRIHLENYEYRLLLDESKVHGAIAMDFDFEGKKYYWTDVALESIFRADFDNNASAVEMVVDNVNTPDGLAVDWINKYIYWTDTGFDRIEVASFDGKMRKTLIDTDLDEPRAIALDPNNGFVYWTDWGKNPKIERCGLNGEDREIIVHTNITWPNGLTIDYAASRLYWIDAKLHTIESANLDGTERVTVLKSHLHLNHPFAITVFEDYLYWTDWPSESVRKFSKFGRDSVETIALDLHSPMDVHVFHPYRQMVTARGKEFCGENKQGCSHFCLPKALKDPSDFTSGSKHYSCACPNGFQLHFNGKTCVESEITTGATPRNGSSTPVPTQPNSPNRSHNRSSTHGPHASSPVTVKVTSEPRVEVTTEGPGAYTIANQHNETKPNTPQRKDEENIGQIAGIVIGVLLALILIAGVVCFMLYRKYSRNHGKSMNFDNPVYRKTTTEELIIEKNRPSNLPASMQPLTQSSEVV